jgi:cytochrome P450
MSATETDLPAYPIVEPEDLAVPPALLALQERGPFKAQMPHGQPIWVATRYEDVKTAYGDRRFGKALGIGKDTPRLHEMAHPTDPSRLDNMDPPDHTRVRRLASTAFAPARIRAMAEWIETMTTELLDDIEAKGPGADYMDLFAWKLPLQVISGILGAPEEQIPTFKGWIDTMTGVDTPFEQRYEAYENIRGSVRELIAVRREITSDDLLCVLVQAKDEGDALNEDELVNLSTTLILGGFETTAAQLGSTVWALMAHRDRWQELVDEPDLVPAAVEELWRWIPSFRHGRPMIRWANEDVELSDGVVIPRGDPILPEHQVANRDESVFPNASEIDFHRNDPAPHLSLAWGPHRCMGAHLANLEVESALRALLLRFPTLDLAVPPEDVVWTRTTFLRSAEALPLTW